MTDSNKSHYVLVLGAGARCRYCRPVSRCYYCKRRTKWSKCKAGFTRFCIISFFFIRILFAFCCFLLSFFQQQRDGFYFHWNQTTSMAYWTPAHAFIYRIRFICIWLIQSCTAASFFRLTVYLCHLCVNKLKLCVRRQTIIILHVGWWPFSSFVTIYNCDGFQVWKPANT